MREIFTRFDIYMKYKGLNDNQVTIQCELSQGLIGQARKGKSDLGKQSIERILKEYQDLSRVWLLTGEGDMLKSANNSPAPSRENSYQEDCVPLLPVEAIAGLTVGFAEGLNLHDCRMIKTPFPGAEYAIQVSGDSMHPTIKSGDMLYIKKINEKAFIPWGHVVVLDTENGAVVKEVYPCEGEEDYIEARSVNPKYPPYKIEKQSIYGMYKVLGTATINTTL